MKAAWSSIAREGTAVKGGRVCLKATSAMEARGIANDIRSAGMLARWIVSGDRCEVEVYEDVRKAATIIGAGAPQEVLATLRNAVYAVRIPPPHPQGA